MAQQMLSKNPLLEIKERDQAGNVVATYIAGDGDEASQKSRVDIVMPRDSQSYSKAFLNAFLPAGYPASVTSDYLEYQIYDSLQAFSSSISGLLSSRAVLEGVGVGDANASPTAAILLSVLQDSMGRIATILFAHKLGTSLEPECKMYRLAADIFNDSAMILDCLSPVFPKHWRVLLLSFSSILRALCGVAAGSSKASLSAHFATQGNLGELNAKDSSQETVISLVGMLAGSLLVSYISTPFATWTALLILLAIHLSTNYFAVRAVSMRTLNRQRANIVFSNFLYSRTKLSTVHSRILSPEEVSPLERVFESDGVLRWRGEEILGNCTLGVPLIAILACVGSSAATATGSYNIPSKGSSTSLTKLLDVFKMEKYILFYSKSDDRFLVVLKKEAETETLLKSWMHALLCATQIKTPSRMWKRTREKLDRTDDGPLVRLLEELLTEVNELWPTVVKELTTSGWDIDCNSMETRSRTRLEIMRMDERI